jgi:hypothetical protein
MQDVQEKIANMSVAGVIRLIRELAVIGVLAYLCIKLIMGEFSLDFGRLSPTELVSILLAFFSIGLSAAFYFAATSQSNQFYDNVNKFSKDTSELLGRLDEQVKGIGGRQSELKDSLDKYYLRDRERGGEAAREEAQEKIKEAERNLSEMVSALLEKANLPVSERTAFEAELKAKDEELSSLRQRVARMSTSRESSVRRYVRTLIDRIGINRAISLSVDDLVIEVAKTGVPPFRRDMVNMGYIKSERPSSPEDITDSGREMVLRALEQAVDEAGRP